MSVRVAASLSLMLSGLALLIAGSRALANLVLWVNPEILLPASGVEQFDHPSAAWGFTRATISAVAWLAVGCLTATLLATSHETHTVVGRLLVGVAGLLFLLPELQVLPGGLTEAAAAAVAMVLGAWCAQSRVDSTGEHLSKG